jgi:hypothetical protein
MPEAIAGFKIYPRGFAGRELPVRIAERPKPYELRIRSPKLFGIVQSGPTILDANQAIEMLYSQYIKRSADTLSFEFKEAVLIAGLQAFGSANFWSWYSTQLQLPTIGENHVRFLSDICRFIQTGKREFTLETWAVLLKPSSEGIRPFKLDAMAQNFFGTSNRAFPADPGQYSLTNVFQRWVAQPQGLEDLLGTLHLLFGNP